MSSARSSSIREPRTSSVPGAAVVPPGDVVEADVAREAADELISALCGLGVDRSGGITLEQIDTALSDAADRAEEDAPGDAADAVVWEELVARTGEESRLNTTFVAFLSIACLLAAVGVITDSPVTIVGAMVSGRSSARSPRSRSGWCAGGGTCCAGRRSRWRWASRSPW